MAASGFTPIILFNSTTAGHVPTTGNLAVGELAINATDGKLYYNTGSAIAVLAGAGGAGIAGGSNTQVQYNSSGNLAGSANMTFNGTTLTLANDASIHGLTVGLGAGSVSSNTAVGVSALASNTTGANSVAVGYQAAYSNTIGDSFAAFGSGALYTNTTGTNNIAIGRNSLYYNTTGSYNTAMGVSALVLNTTASTNNAFGYQAGYSNTTGTLDVFGYQAGYGNTTGTYNVAMGYKALTTNSTGSYNTAIGQQSLQANTTANYNTGIGYQALYSATSNSNNTSIGYQSGLSCSSGVNNTFLGTVAGYNLTSGSNNIYIGYNSQASSTSVTYEVVIGSGATGRGASTGYYAQASVYNYSNTTLWNITSDQRIKKNIVDNNTGLDVINKIQVRNFEYRLPEEITDLPQEQAIAKKGTQLGVIAQELQQVLPECVKTESSGVMTVNADSLTWYLVNAVKELSAQVAQLQSQLKVN